MSGRRTAVRLPEETGPGAHDTLRGTWELWEMHRAGDQGELKISTMDRVHLSEEQLRQGYRLACQAMPESEVTVEFTAFH